MAQQKIYIVDNVNEHPPRAVFDSKEKALKYTTRFKKNKEYTIFEQELNPHFEVAPDKMVLEIEFDLGGTIRISRTNSQANIELATANGYVLDSGALCCYTLAKDEGEAMINAMKIRDRAIAEGEWEVD